jgi:hypothetical protein
VAEDDVEEDSSAGKIGGFRVFADFLPRVPEDNETMEASVADG